MADDDATSAEPGSDPPPAPFVAPGSQPAAADAAPTGWNPEPVTRVDPALPAARPFPEAAPVPAAASSPFAATYSAPAAYPASASSPGFASSPSAGVPIGGATVPWEAQSWAPVPEKRRSAFGLVGLVLGVLALLSTLILGAFVLAAWLLAFPAIILAIVGFARSKDRNGLPIAALLSGIAAIVVSTAIFAFSVVDDIGDVIEAADDWVGSPRGAFDEDGNRGVGTLEEPVPVGETFSYDASFDGEDATVWDVTVNGYVDLPEQDEFAEGWCVAVVGSIVPTHVIEGEATSWWIDTPDIVVMIDDEPQYGYGGCDVSGVEDAGYRHLWEAEVPEGEAYDFYYELWIPAETQGDIQAIVVGDPDSEGAAFIQAVKVEE